MSYYNEEQLEHLQYLASIPPEQKCKCGWYTKVQVKRGEHCPNCKETEKTK